MQETDIGKALSERYGRRSCIIDLDLWNSKKSARMPSGHSPHGSKMKTERTAATAILGQDKKLKHDIFSAHRSSNGAFFTARDGIISQQHGIGENKRD